MFTVPSHSSTVVPATGGKMDCGRWGFRGFLMVFFVATLLEVMGRRGPFQDVWISAAIWSFAAMGLLAVLSRQLPVQNAVAVAVGAGGLGWLMSRWTLPDGFPELLCGVVWIVLAVGSRGSARWILRRWYGKEGYGWGVLALGTVLTLGMLAGGVFAGPAGTSDGNWAMAGRWTATSILIHLVTTPWFIDKRPIINLPDGRPVAVMVLLMVWQWVLNSV